MEDAVAGNYRVGVKIEVRNRTGYPMVSPVCFIKSGVVVKPPQRIEAGETGVMVMHKTPGAAGGSYGSVSWLINDQRAVVMWSAPFNFNHHENRLAVGFIDKDGHEEWLTEKIYNGNANGNCATGVYYKTCNEIEFTKNNHLITGIMGTSHNATACVLLKRADQYRVRI